MVARRPGRRAPRPPGGERRAVATDEQPTWRFRGEPPALEWVADGWHLRVVQPYRALKVYRCPGCDQEIFPRTMHVAALLGTASRGPAAHRRAPAPGMTSAWRRHQGSRGAAAAGRQI